MKKVMSLAIILLLVTANFSTANKFESKLTNKNTISITDNGTDDADCFIVDVVCGPVCIVEPKVTNNIYLDVIITPRCLYKLVDGAYFQTDYTLLEAPSGMSVNGNGVISWNPSASLLNQTFPVRVKVEHCIYLNGVKDGTEGVGYCDFEVQVKYKDPIEP